MFLVSVDGPVNCSQLLAITDEAAVSFCGNVHLFPWGVDFGVGLLGHRVSTHVTFGRCVTVSQSHQQRVTEMHGSTPSPTEWSWGHSGTPWFPSVFPK